MSTWDEVRASSKEAREILDLALEGQRIAREEALREVAAGLVEYGQTVVGQREAYDAVLGCLKVVSGLMGTGEDGAQHEEGRG